MVHYNQESRLKFALLHFYFTLLVLSYICLASLDDLALASFFFSFFFLFDDFWFLVYLIKPYGIYMRFFIQSGCCKPPLECNFKYQNETFWIKSSTSTSNNTDCNEWSNDPSVLCYNCQSCKAGVLDNIKNDWKKVAIINIIVLVFLVIVYSIGCCAFRNNRRDDAYGGWKGYP